MVLIYIYSAKCTIMGQSYVYQLLWGLTLVHKIVVCTVVGPSCVCRLLWGLALVHKCTLHEVGK